MSNNYVNPNDPSRRQPYQYQPQGSQSPRSQPPDSSYSAPTIPVRQGNNNQARIPYPYSQSGPQSRPKRRRKGCMIGCLGVLAILVIFAILAGTTVSKALAFGSAISPKAPLSTETGYMTTSQRTSLLIMGYGGSGHDGAYLTDSLVVISLMPQSQHTSLVSVPRDLWVQNPYEGQGVYTKLNALYSDASQNNTNPIAGGNATAQKVQTVTGLNVQYWLTINFSGFQDFIDSIGGIDVNVPDAFTANYPANDDPTVNASWTTVHFDKGNQHLDGKSAIEYARARYVTDNLAEASDFARSVRQQIIIKAALAKVKSISTWPKLLDAQNALQKAVYTNMSLADLAGFALKMDLNSPQTAHIGLGVDNVMAYDTSSDGQSIVVPQNYDWPAVQDYVQQHLYA
ncbi:MAG TPA: LCP family protein [Ktedonobacteraceae bacterium]